MDGGNNFTKDLYSQKLENQLKQWEVAIRDLEERAPKGPAHVKLELLELIEKLQLKMAAIQIEFEDLRQSSKTWADGEKRLETALSEMRAVLELAGSKFKH